MTRSLRGVMAALLLGALAACGNNPETAGDFALLRGFGAQALGGGAAPQAPPDPASLSRALAQIPASQGVLRVERVGGDRAILAVENGRNQGYTTFTTPEGQAITMRRGVITGTRGLVFDLMSATLNGADANITARRAADYERTYRFLSGENREVPFRASCATASEGGERITLASGATIATTRMRETCQAGPFTFNNFYWVTSGGTIRRSHQWVSREVGELRIDVLRD